MGWYVTPRWGWDSRERIVGFAVKSVGEESNMRLRTVMGTGLVAVSASMGVWAADKAPAVLFYGYAPHNAFVVKPLHELGIQVDTCKGGELAKTLALNRHNVVVVGTMTAAERDIVDAFAARGGGVFVCNPVSYPREAEFTLTCEWLTKLGARPRWEMLQDSDKENLVKVTFGELSWSDDVKPPVNAGVPGVLTMVSGSTTGIEPAMSYEFGPEWQVVVRGAKTMATKTDPRNDPVLQPWLPKAPVPASPPLMGLREIGKGRVAVIPFRDYWILCPPANCPPSEAMLKLDTGAKKSDWLRVFANAMRWLAAPSLAAGIGGAETPAALLNPPVTPWDIPKETDWAKLAQPLAAEPDMAQNPGLVGARTALSSGTGTVTDYVTAAKTAGLKFVVFLEDSLVMDQAKWDQLVKECTAASDDSFVAVPGLTYEDAQGNHLYVFADNVRFPKPSMLLPDKRLATTQSYRTRAYFDYINELIGQKDLNGFWRHKENYLHFTDYKLYNSFPVYSFENGKPIDDALSEYLYWQNIGGLQAVLAFEIMTSPEQVPVRAKNGWRVVWNRGLKSLREGTWHQGAYSFSGQGSQYITSGPSILLWRTVNNLVGSNGLWWRPDLWEYRLRLRVGSEVGLKSVTLHDGDRQVVRRWLPNGAQKFEQELVLSNCQQFAATLVVEDVNGGRAVSMGYWNRNLNMEEFFCSDRCNILGSCRLRLKSNGTQYWTPVGFAANMGNTPSKGGPNINVAPSVSLTPNSPTIPVDGAPAGLPPTTINLGPGVPGELPHLFSYPSTYEVGPEMAVGQTNYILGYDPAEYRAKATPLGHPYDDPAKQEGTGNSWSSWHKLVPLKKLSGYSRTYACNWLTQGFRLGWHETHVVFKEPVTVDPKWKGILVASTQGIVYRDGKPVSGPGLPAATGTFGRGVFSMIQHAAGATVMVGMSDRLEFRAEGMNVYLIWKPAAAEIATGEVMDYTIPFAGADGHTTTEQILEFVAKFGVAVPGQAGYAPKMRTGRQLDNYFVWRLAADNGAVETKVPKAAMPGFLTAVVEGLNDNWSVQLLDRARPWPNHRALPIRDGLSFAQLDTNDAAQDLFLGHPVTADQKELKILVSWVEPGKWYVEAHNPTDKPMTAALRSAKGWTPFKFRETVDLPPGTSKVWTVTGK